MERSDRPFKEQHRREHIMQTHQNMKIRKCDICGSKYHKAIACNRIQDINEKREIISSKGICFNCIGKGHRASNCKSQRSFMTCKGHHHTPLCMDGTKQKSPTTRIGSNNTATGQKLFITPGSKAIYPVVVVKVNGITCRNIPDTSAGSSYISSTLARKLRRPPIWRDYKQTETMLHTTNTLIDNCDVEITNAKGDFTINTEVSQVDIAELISMANPH